MNLSASGSFEMESSYVGVSAVVQNHSECMSDTRSRLWQISNQLVTKDELICPKPHYATKVPFIMDTQDRFGSKPKSILPLKRRDCSPDILDAILTKDDDEENSEATNQMGFFGGSPPIRTDNPVVNDPCFVRQTMTTASPLGISPQIKPTAKRNSPSCGTSRGSKPKVRVEGFMYGSPDSHHGAIPALA